MVYLPQILLILYSCVFFIVNVVQAGQKRYKPDAITSFATLAFVFSNPYFGGFQFISIPGLILVATLGISLIFKSKDTEERYYDPNTTFVVIIIVQFIYYKGHFYDSLIQYLSKQ